MARGKAHSDEVRAQVIAALLAGQGVGDIAAEYNLPQQTVSTIKATLTPEQFGELRCKKGEILEELIFKFLTTIFGTLQKQAEVVADADYIKKQPASELATLFGVMADKGVRILEAAERARLPITEPQR